MSIGDATNGVNFAAPQRGYQRLAMYIVISKPKRKSENSGFVHCIAISLRIDSGY
jgi:hypothetical protein